MKASLILPEFRDEKGQQPRDGDHLVECHRAKPRSHLWSFDLWIRCKNFSCVLQALAINYDEGPLRPCAHGAKIFNIISIAKLLAFENVIGCCNTHTHTHTHSYISWDDGSALGHINPTVVNHAPVNAINKLAPTVCSALTRHYYCTCKWFNLASTQGGGGQRASV
jgi:hypothetical protein